MATDWDAAWAELIAERNSRPAAEYPSFGDQLGYVVWEVVPQDEYIAVYLFAAIVVGLERRRLGRIILCVTLSVIASGFVLANAGFLSLGGERFVWSFATFLVVTLVLSEVMAAARKWISARLSGWVAVAKGEKDTDKNANNLW